MQRRWLPEEECRLTLLCCLEALGPVTDRQLESFVLRRGLAGYFDLALNLAALTDQGQVSREPHPAGPLLRLTEAGARALDAFRGRVPASSRQTIAEAAPAERARFARSRQAPCRFDGREAELTLTDRGQAVAALRLRLPEGARPEAVRARWEAAAPALWRRVTAALYGDGTVPDTPAEPASPDGWRTLAASGPGGLSLRVRTADKAEARRSAANWPGCRDELERAVRAALTGEEEHHADETGG